MNVAINFKAFIDKISDRDFEQLCADNPEAKFEVELFPSSLFPLPSSLFPLPFAF
jgi:hypothetical protein